MSHDSALLQGAALFSTPMGVIVVSQKSTKRTLSQVRRQNLLSVHELAAKAGVSASTIFRIEEKGIAPQLSTIRKIAEALDVDATTIEWPGDPLGMGESDDGE